MHNKHLLILYLSNLFVELLFKCDCCLCFQRMFSPTEFHAKYFICIFDLSVLGTEFDRD